MAVKHSLQTEEVYHCRGKAGVGMSQKQSKKHQAGGGGDPKFVKTRKQLLFFSVSQAEMDETASVCVNMQTRWI